MGRVLAAVGFWVLLGVTGCATKIYQGPTSGRGAESQQAVSRSLEKALEGFQADRLKGSKVVIEVYALTPRLDGDSAEERYLRGLLIERLLQAGATVVATREDANVLLAATLQTAGVDVIRRDVPFIYHHTTFRGVARLRLNALALQGRSVIRPLSQAKLGARSIYRETYIFYAIGPITTRYTEPLPPDAP